MFHIFAILALLLVSTVYEINGQEICEKHASHNNITVLQQNWFDIAVMIYLNEKRVLLKIALLTMTLWDIGEKRLIAKVIFVVAIVKAGGVVRLVK